MSKEKKPKSRWVGNKQNGIEIRYSEGESKEVIDELLLYVDGKCIMHMEAMSEVCYAFGFYLSDSELHMNVVSRNLKSHIDAIVQD